MNFLKFIKSFKMLSRVKTVQISLKTQGNLKPLHIQKRTFMGIPNEFFYLSTAITGTGAIAFMANRYKVSKPDEYLVRTGLGIRDIKITKQGFQFPFQSYKFISMQPQNYRFNLNSMSKEKLEFVLPGVFTIGPKNDVETLKDYVRFLENADSSNIINGILEGETRILCGQLTLEEIFNDRKALKEKIIENVQLELSNFGLIIYNANIIELHDAVGSEYFKYLRQDKTSKAQNDAIVKVAENKKHGDVGQKLMEAETRQTVVDLESKTVVIENKRNEEILKSKAIFAITKAETEKTSSIADVEAKNFILSRTAELERDLEEKKIQTQIERLRATELTKVQVDAEKHIKESEGKAMAVQIDATAVANATKIKADAELYFQQKKAEGELYFQQKKAEGVLASLNAQSDGLNRLMGSLGNPGAIMQYLMIEKDMFARIAKENAVAIKDMKPKITIWDTGKGDSASDSIQNLMKSLPPLLTTVYDQTGIKPADWLVNMRDMRGMSSVSDAPKGKDEHCRRNALNNRIEDLKRLENIVETSKTINTQYLKNIEENGGGYGNRA